MSRRAILLERLARKRQADRMEEARKVSLALAALSRTETQLAALQSIIPGIETTDPLPPGALKTQHSLSLVIVEQIDQTRQIQDAQRRSVDKAREALARAELRARLTEDHARIAKTAQAAAADLGT